MGKSCTFEFNAGESASPEMCLQACVRRGRGHTHPMLCLGGDRCAERIHTAHAFHSEESFYPNYDARYDLLECSTYWRIHNWEAPVQSKDPTAQEEFGLCNFSCNHPSHTSIPDGTKVWCNDKLFHSHSDDY